MLKYYSTKDTLKILGVCRKTLYNWSKSGKIEYIETPGGWRKYDLSFLNKTHDEEKQKVNICYCRVSSNGQKDSLEKQVATLKEKYPSYLFITDIGSGINFKRKGLCKLIDMALNNEINKIVIAYKDRLCRIGFEMFEYLFKKLNVNLIIENTTENISDITNDILEIMTVYSS